LRLPLILPIFKMFFKPSFLIATLPLLFSSLSQAAPSSSRSNPDCDEKIGYLWTSFPVDDEAIYMHLSNNNDPLKNWTALSLDGTKDTQAILRSNIGNKGARDSFIQPSQDGSKYWLTVSTCLSPLLFYFTDNSSPLNLLFTSRQPI